MSIWLPGRNASTPMLTMRPPLTTLLTLPLMRPSPWNTLDDLLPILAVERLFAGEDDHALVVFEPFEEHVDLIADVHVVEVVEFGERDDTLRLVADVHEGFARAEFEDVAFDDGAFAEVAHRLRNEFLHS